MRTAENSRIDLVVVYVGSCSVDDFLQISTGRVYIRPIQTNLEVDESLTVQASDEMEECLSCGKL